MSRPERKKSGSEEGPGVNSAHVGCRGGRGGSICRVVLAASGVYTVQLLLSAVQAGIPEIENGKGVSVRYIKLLWSRH
jgi:hypothetical protein